MPTFSREQCLERLRAAYRRGNLTLYLGAGVSVANGLPNWERLVLAMYFSAIEALDGDTNRDSLRPFSNYLFAIAEWHLKRGHEPLDITARKVRTFYEAADGGGRGDEEFIGDLRATLYAGFVGQGSDFVGKRLRRANRTLAAVADLCEGDEPARGVRAVVTYNYDNLLETTLQRRPFQSVWKAEQTLEADKLPIYHVHGYVPIGGEGSTADEIVFTEEQYHRESQATYSWSNLVQLQCMSSSVGLMVGLSLTDRNMRRLLDATMKTPLRSENYAIIQRPQWQTPTPNDLNQINRKALEYLENFRRSGSKAGIKEANRAQQMLQILRHVEELDVTRQESVFERLGIHPIWYDDHGKVPGLLKKILRRA